MKNWKQMKQQKRTKLIILERNVKNKDWSSDPFYRDKTEVEQIKDYYATRF